MRLHHLAIALAVLAATPAHAICTDITDVTVIAIPNSGSGSGRVEYNPFTPVNTALTIHATYDANCDAAHAAQIIFPVTGGEITNFPVLEVQSGVTTVYRTNASYNDGGGQSVSFPIVSPGANDGAANLTALPVAQSALEIAFSPTGSQHIDVDVLFEVDGGLEIRRSVEIPVETVLRRTVALTDSFTMGDFGTIDGTNQTIDRKLFLWSNDGFKITASSLNGGIMLRDGGASGSVEINSIPYTLVVATGSSVLLRLDESATANVVVETGPLDPTIVDGNQYDIVVDIAADDGTGKRAGFYEDTVTLTIASPI